MSLKMSRYNIGLCNEQVKCQRTTSNARLTMAQTCAFSPGLHLSEKNIKIIFIRLNRFLCAKLTLNSLLCIYETKTVTNRPTLVTKSFEQLNR